jgi:hypothetical protein
VLYVNPGDRPPAGYFVIAVNPRASRQQILGHIGALLEESLERARRQRFSADDVKRFVLWYYELGAGVRTLKELAIDEAQRQSRPRATKRGRRGSGERAIAQAKSRIIAGRNWLLSQIPGAVTLRHVLPPGYRIGKPRARDAAGHQRRDSPN